MEEFKRFLDEMPPIEEEVIIAYSSSPYNGKTFLTLGKNIDNKKVQLIGNYTILIYDKDFKDDFFVSGYAHHWVYKNHLDRSFSVEKICEYERRKRGDKEPVKL